MGASWYHFPSVSLHLLGTVTIFCWVPLPGTTTDLTKVFKSVSIKCMQLMLEDRRQIKD